MPSIEANALRCVYVRGMGACVYEVWGDSRQKKKVSYWNFVPQAGGQAMGVMLLFSNQGESIQRYGTYRTSLTSLTWPPSV